MLRRSLHVAFFLVASLVSSLYSLSAFAAESAIEGPMEYTLTRQYGSVFFRVFHQQTLNLVGRFDMYAGTLILDPANLANAAAELR